jgi:NAD(P)H-dependent flavin oxidoreductase YrpB (nitropropane dioxygenase family)
MKQGNELDWTDVVMAANAPVMTKAGLVDGRTDVGVLPTGQVTGVLDSLPSAAEVISSIVTEANETLGRLGA